jgi:hypothetical protein
MVVTEEKRDFIAGEKRERWGGGLSAQADAFIPQKKQLQAREFAFFTAVVVEG